MILRLGLAGYYIQSTAGIPHIRSTSYISYLLLLSKAFKLVMTLLLVYSYSFFASPELEAEQICSTKTKYEIQNQNGSARKLFIFQPIIAELCM